MVVVPTQIRTMTSVLTHEGVAEALAQDLAALEDVADTCIDTERRPHRVVARLASHQERLPEGVRDILSITGSRLEDVENLSGGQPVLHIEPAQPWRPAGQRTVRAHGGSIVVTLTREALEASGLAEDDEVDLEARSGQVRITRRAE